MRIHINTHVSAREPADTGDDDEDDEDPSAPPSVPRTDGAITDAFWRPDAKFAGNNTRDDTEDARTTKEHRRRGSSESFWVRVVRALETESIKDARRAALLDRIYDSHLADDDNDDGNHEGKDRPLESWSPRDSSALRALLEDDAMEDGAASVVHARAQAMSLIRSRTWTLLDDPSSSKAARAVSVATLALILISSLAFCLETMPQLTASADARLAFHAIESVCVGLFTLEYFLRLAACPNTRAFLTSPMNAVDLVAIAPFYLALFVDNSGGAGGARMLRTLRLVRVTRLFKLGGRVARLRVVASSMRESADMLAMMVFLLAVAVLVFATLVFYVERGEYVPEDPVDGSGGFYSRRSDASCSPRGWNVSDSSLGTSYVCERHETPFKSIPDSFWWTVVTLMTVGYGDEIPTTGAGKFVACVAMVASLLLLALPISVIGTEFTEQWMEYKQADAEASRANTGGDAPVVGPTSRSIKPAGLVESERVVSRRARALEETLRRVRAVTVDAGDRVHSVDTMVRAKRLEQGVIERRAAKLGASAEGSESALRLLRDVFSDGEDRRLVLEVEALAEERERLRAVAEVAEGLGGDGAPGLVLRCLDRYALLAELTEDDGEVLVGEARALRERALRLING